MGPTRASLFIVVTIDPRPESATAVRAMCPGLAALIRAVGFRDTAAGLSCVMSFGSAAWDRLFGDPRPAELHPFREIVGGSRKAVSTPGDALFHIRSSRPDFCFELATQILSALGDAVSVEDEVHAFSYFDNRDLLGFVDGTENPVDKEALDAVLIRDEDPAFECGSYVIVQKVSTRPGGLERSADGNPGANHRPHQGYRHRVGRRRQTDLRAPGAQYDRRGRSREEDLPRQRNLWTARARRVRYLFHRLRAIAAAHRADAREHVRRAAAGQLRSHSGFQPSRNRLPVFCAVGVVPRQRDTGWNCVGNGRFRPRSERLFT